jgi:hypothetical protein
VQESQEALAELHVLESALELLTPVLHPLNLQIFRLRSSLLSTALVAADMVAALKYCQAIVDSYRLCYPPFQPMLGLQLYTLGSLQQSLGLYGILCLMFVCCNVNKYALANRKTEAAASLTEALAILTVAYGSESPFVQELAASVDG